MHQPRPILPVILSGGSGSRLWPASRELYPKQILSMADEAPLLVETLERIAAPQFLPPLIICNEEHRFLVRMLLADHQVAVADIILEPVPRNTAPAAMVAAAYALSAAGESGEPPLLLLLPSDHKINDAEMFRQDVLRAIQAAEAGHIVTFGIRPASPETGYGYIKPGGGLVSEEIQAVAAFTEKPDAALAQEYISEGCLWNSGVFLAAPGVLLAEGERHAPDIAKSACQALKRAEPDLGFLRLDPAAFTATPAQSLDYAVMEKTGKAAVLPARFDWCDMGSWHALWRLGGKDKDGNVLAGDVLVRDTKESIIHSREGALTVVLGLQDVIVVATEDAILVCDKAMSESVKGVVRALRNAGRTEHLVHRKVYRPWGTYRLLAGGDRFKVKEICVFPGACLSLQYHHHRAEHWVVVEGEGEVTRDEEVLRLGENQSTYIASGQTHQLKNTGSVPLKVIEVQSGSYLGEDDIVRVHDPYGRR